MNRYITRRKFKKIRSYWNFRLLNNCNSKYYYISQISFEMYVIDLRYLDSILIFVNEL